MDLLHVDNGKLQPCGHSSLNSYVSSILKKNRYSYLRWCGRFSVPSIVAMTSARASRSGLAGHT